MSALFHQSSSASSAPAGGWDPVSLSPGQTISLREEGLPAVRVAGDVAPAVAEVFLRVVEAPGGEVRHHLVAGRGAAVRVGGQRLVGGLKRLARRREVIVVGNRPFFLALEDLAQVAPFEGGVAPGCVRCKGPIEPGCAHVVCPKCGLAYHEDGGSGFGCYTAGPCVGCGSDPLLGSENAWSPECL